MNQLNTQNLRAAAFVSIFVGLLIFDQTHLLGQSDLGRPQITNYSYHDYGAGPINWSVIEDDQGIMYFANGQGVLQYDGANWTLIRNEGGQAARSLTKDEDGVIYVGFNGDMGFLQPDAKGIMQFMSLKDKIPDSHQVFFEVWEVELFQGDIYFRTDHKLFRWNGEKMEVLEFEDGLHVGRVVNDQHYLRVWNRGLCVLEDDTLRLLPGGEIFSQERIYSLLPYDDDRILIGSRTQGLFLYDGQQFTPFKSEADAQLKDGHYLPGAAIGKGRFVLNTFSNGAYIIDSAGHLLQEITSENGLQDNSVDYVYVDSRGVLWMALFNGISSVNLNSNFTYFDQNSGLPSNVVFGVHRFKDIIYAGTNNGLYYLRPNQEKFELMEGTHGQGGTFIKFKGRLFHANSGLGFIEIKGDKFIYVKKSVDYKLRGRQMIHSKIDSNRVYFGHTDGLTSFYFNEVTDQFDEESFTDKMLATPGGFEEDRLGNIWTDGKIDGTADCIQPKIIDGVLDLSDSKYIAYDTSHGLPNTDINFWKYNGVLEFFGDQTMYTFDQSENKFVASETDYDEFFDSTALYYPAPKIDHLGRTWINPGSGVVVKNKTPEGLNKFTAAPFLETKNASNWGIFIDERSTEDHTIAWFTGPDGITRYEGNLDDAQIPSLDVNIRRLGIRNDSLIYGGDVNVPENTQIRYTDNTVTVGYASPFYVGEKDLEYQTQLAGYSDDWSNWTKQTEREYINLPTGEYTFKVRAKNLFGAISDVDEISFRVRPPWYRTWLAYLFYAMAAAALIYWIVRNRTESLRRQQRELEAKVQERTGEVQQRVDELATVNRVSLALTEKLELDELINLVGNQIKKLFKANISYVAIHDPQTDIINFPFQDGDSMAPLKFGEGLTSKIINTGEPLLINQDISKEYDEMGIQQVGKNASSYLGVPIPMENKYVGVLSVQSTEQENRFDDNDKRLLTTIARNVGSALHNAELYEEAKAAKAQAEDANEAKSAFLSTVSHELRTPLTSVLGFAKIIRKRLEDKIFPTVPIEDQKIKRTMKQVTENLGVVVSEGERLTKLINDVLDLAKIESGRMEWHLKPTFLQDVINRAISATASLFENKKLELVKNIPSDLPVVNADQDKLIQVVINLLSNAVKFTDKGQVTVEAYQDDGQIIIEVQDTGIGVAEEDKHKVFERFRQAGDTLTDKPQGTGLGLPICREIIEHHGGIIWMKSEFGVGSTFFFSIPILGDPASAQPLQLDRIVKSLKKQIQHGAIPATDASQTILVVDDDTPIRSLLRQELSDSGYEVKEAANGKAALDMVRIAKPDLIILDVMMPEINGFDVAAVLKNDPDTMDIPIIILSIVQDQERGLRIGVDRYLTKPIDTEKLFHEVDALLEQGVSKKKVLVVDEDETTVKTLSEVLSARGYNVLEANGGDLIETAV